MFGRLQVYFESYSENHNPSAYVSYVLRDLSWSLPESATALAVRGSSLALRSAPAPPRVSEALWVEHSRAVLEAQGHVWRSAV